MGEVDRDSSVKSIREENEILDQQRREEAKRNAIEDHDVFSMEDLFDDPTGVSRAEEIMTECTLFVSKTEEALSKALSEDRE